MDRTKTVHHCPDCNEEIVSVGWGSRVQCPNCGKWVTVTSVEVPVIQKEKGGTFK